MDIQKSIDRLDVEIEELKTKIDEEHMLCQDITDLEELIDKAIMFGDLCAKRDAKAQAVPEQVLDAPACVGGGAFQKGVKWSTVIGAAQRHYENDGHHEAPAICIRDQLRVASGHSVVVPKEPTYEMLEAGSEARSRTEGHIASIWEVMIEAQEQSHDSESFK